MREIGEMLTLRDHQSKNLFDPWEYLGPQRRRLLEKSWAGVFSGRGGRSPPRRSGRAAEWLSKAEAHVDQGKPERAIVLRRAIAVEPDDPTVLMGYAMACARLDRSPRSKWWRGGFSISSPARC